MKISKSIKRLRAENGLTQEQLAEKLFISRQSVSSWENDRTQPDIEMLGKLSETFGVSLEELIYGKKHNTALETQKPDHNSTLIIVFSILGTLLAGAGLVLIFINFWQKMPVLFKSVLSFLPLIAGQAAGIFVLFRKKDKIPWCEGAGVLWCAGIAATLTMIYNIFNMGFYWEALLVIEAVLIIPVILLLKCVAPLAVFYGCTLAWFIKTVQDEPYVIIPLTVIFIAAGCIFTTRLVKRENKSIRSICAQWISTAAASAFFFFLEAGLTGDIILLFTAAGAVGLCLLIISLKDSDIAMPYRIPGLILTSVFLFASAAYYYGDLEREKWNIALTVISILAVISALACIILTKTKVKDSFLLSYAGVGILVLIAFPLVSFFLPRQTPQDNTDAIFITVMKIIAIIANILLMISGGREKKLLNINTGFISVTALTVLIVAQSGFSMIINGLLLLIAGAVLLVINYRLSKKPKTAVIAENTDGEVQSDE